MINKKEPFLYVQIQKALYGLLRSALMFYRNLVKGLESCGFQINPYDPCVANKLINGKYMTVVFNGDDLKLSHIDSFEVTKFTGHLLSIYVGLSVHRGEIHYCLEIGLYYRKQVPIKISLIEFLMSDLNNQKKA